MKNRLHFLFKFDIIQKQSKIASVAQQVEQLIRNQQVAGPNPATSSKLLKLTKASQSGAFRLLFAICRIFPFRPLRSQNEREATHAVVPRAVRWGCPCFGVGGRFGIGDLPIKNSELIQNRIVFWINIDGSNSANSKLLKLTKASQGGAFRLLFAICRFFPFRLLIQN